jgi:hypothetical protein
VAVVVMVQTRQRPAVAVVAVAVIRLALRVVVQRIKVLQAVQVKAQYHRLGQVVAVVLMLQVLQGQLRLVTVVMALRLQYQGRQ